MQELPKADKVIEINLQSVAKESMYLTILALILLLPIHFFLVGELYFSFTLLANLLFLVGYIVLIVLHEFFHLLGFRLFSNVPWKRMKVGVNLKLGIAYATTDKLMSNRSIRKALLLPFWLTGILPGLIGLYINSAVLIILAAFLIGGAVGDFAMYRALKKLPDEWLIKDDPKLPRLYVYRPENIVN